MRAGVELRWWSCGCNIDPEMTKELSQLERDTAAYFENMSEEEEREDRELEAALWNTPKPDVDALEE